MQTLPILLLLLFSSSALAQTTRTEVLNWALKTPSVEIAESRLQSAEIQLNSARVPLSGSASAGYNNSGGQGAFSGGLNLSFAGFFGEAAAARVNAEVGVQRARLGVQYSKIRAQQKGLRLWHSLRRAEAGLGIQRFGLEIAQLEEKQAAQRLAAGSINGFERQAVARRLESAQLEVLRAEQALQAAQTQASLEWQRDVKNASNVWQPLLLPTFNAALLEQREDVFEARVAWAMAGMALENARRQLLPTASASVGVSGSSGSASLSLNNNLGVGLGLTFGNNPNAPTTWSFGLQISIPINPSGIAQLTPLERQLEQSRRALQSTLQLAQLDVQTRLQAQRNAQTGLRLALEQQRFAEQNRTNQLERQRLGLIGLLEVQKAQLEVLRAGDEVLSAQNTLDQTSAEVFESLGKLLEEIK